MGACLTTEDDYHDCAIAKNLRTEDQEERPPQTAYYVKLFDRFRTITAISSRNPLTKEYFRSNAAIVAERVRHTRTGYKYIIHPFSVFCYYRQRLLVILWLCALYKNTFTMAFYPRFEASAQRNLFWELFDTLIDVLLLVDIVLNFFTGYQVRHSQEIVVVQKKICIHYLSTYFFFELLGTVPIVDMIMSVYPDVNAETLLYLTFLRAGRFVRLFTMLEYLEDWGHVWRLDASIITCVCQLIMSVYYIHWIACIIFTVPCVEYYQTSLFPKDSWITQSQIEPFRKNVSGMTRYLHSLLCAVCHFFAAGIGMYTTKYVPEQICFSIILILGNVYITYVLALVIQIFGSVNASETKYEELIHQLHEYMRSKRLPLGLKRRLRIYYENKFQKNYFKEEAILAALPEHLRCEVFLHNCRSLIFKVSLFQGLSRSVIGAIIGYLKPEVYLTGDVVAKQGEPCEDVWFISYGAIALFKKNGSELCHLEDGHYFGGAKLAEMSEERYDVNAIAISTTELFRMSKRDFHRIVRTHLEFKRRLVRFAAKYKAELHRRDSDDEDEDEVEDEDESGHDEHKNILTELKKGRILEKPKERK